MKDKIAITNAAQAFAARGQIDEAIAEWSKLLDEGKDGNIYNTIGDLYLKKRSENKAIESFTKAANIFREDGFYPKAIALYKKILNIMPNNLDARIALAELNAERGFIIQAIEDLLNVADKLKIDGAIEKALEVYEKALRVSPSNINIKMTMAELSLKIGLKERAAKGYAVIASDYLEKGEADKAQEFYQKSIDIYPKNITSLIGLSNLAEKSNNLDQALEYLSRAASQAPENKSIILNYSKLAIKVNKIEDAKNNLLKLAETDPSDIDTKKLLGSLYLSEGQLKKAWDELQPCIDDEISVRNWANALELLNNFKDTHSIPVSQRFINVYRGKGDNEVLSNKLKELANLYVDKGSIHEALPLLKECMELNPNDRGVKEKIHELESTMGISSPSQITVPIEESPEAHTHAISPEHEQTGISQQEGEAVSPQYLAAKKTEADFYAQQGLRDEAIKIYEELLATFPDNEEIGSALNAVKASKSVIEGEGTNPQEQISGVNVAMNEVLQEMEEKTESGEKNYESHFQLGITYRRQGFLDEAIREFQNASEDPEKILRNSRILALCYMEKGSYSSAIKEFEKVIKAMSPDDTGYLDVLYELAEAYVNNRDDDNALKTYTRIHFQDSAFRDVSEKLEVLKARTVKAPDEPEPEPKKGRISYL